MDDLLGGAEWQTVLLYGGLLLIVAATLWRWHTSPIYKNFSLLHAISNREGYYDPDRAHLSGSFLIAAFAVVVSVIRNSVDAQVVLLVGGLVSAFALKSGWSYTVNRKTESEVVREEIRRGRATDEPLEEEKDGPRRRSTDSVFK